MNFNKLIWKEPWLSPVILNITHIEKTDAVPTVAVSPNGKELYYNPMFWKTLSAKEKLGVQIHELLHIANLHAKRRKHRRFELWNIACDIAINCQITSSGYILPKGALDGENEKAENIYDRLRKSTVQTDANGENNKYSPYNSLHSHKNGNNLSNKNNDCSSSQMRKSTASIGNFADTGETKFCTPLADDLLTSNRDGSETTDDSTLNAVETAVKLASIGNTALSKVFVPIISAYDWRTVLRNFVKSAIGDEYDYLSYEFDEFGVCEDILSPKPKPKICVLADESGSIDDRLYKKFLGELEKLEGCAEVFVSGFAWNTELNAVPLKKYRRSLSGGTDVRKAYLEACKKDFDCIIVLTDGCLQFPESEPKPTIWAMPQSFRRKTEVLL